MQRKFGGSEPKGYLGVKDENVIRNDIAQFTRSEHPASILRHLVVVKGERLARCLHEPRKLHFPLHDFRLSKDRGMYKRRYQWVINCLLLSEKPSDTTAKMQFTTGLLSLLFLTPLALASPIRTCVNELQTFQSQVSPVDTSAMVSVHLISYSDRTRGLH